MQVLNVLESNGKSPLQISLLEVCLPRGVLGLWLATFLREARRAELARLSPRVERGLSDCNPWTSKMVTWRNTCIHKERIITTCVLLKVLKYIYNCSKKFTYRDNSDWNEADTGIFGSHPSEIIKLRGNGYHARYASVAIGCWNLAIATNCFVLLVM
jgi:hypothetical protein